MESALSPSLTKPCNSESFGISSAFPSSVAMNRRSAPLKPLLAGLLLTLAQLVAAVLFIAPEGSLAYRYGTLNQHDSFWFANIVNRGYATIVPPINHKVMEVSNVAFFPAYPAITAALHYGLHLSTANALLVASQGAAWGFWSYFFLFCDRWNISPTLQFFGALSVVAHPTAFFLVAGYSESLFMMTLLGFIYWSSAEGRVATALAALHGFTMSATRIVGIPCAAFPVVRSIFENGWGGVRDVRSWPRRYFPAVGLMICGTLGAISFFVYCMLRWGRWDTYMLTQQLGWAIEPDYLAVFRPESYRWLVPALKDPTEASQMAMTLGAVMFVVVAICEVLPAIRRRTAWTTRIGIYFCAVIIYYIAVSGVACVEMESMLRYQFCAHALIVLAFLHYLRQFHTPPRLVRVFSMAAVALASAAGLGVQGWYVWNFTRGNWVA